MRQLIDSQWYQSRFGDVFKPLNDDWVKTKFSNDRAGFRLCTSVNGTVTGEHADVQVCDDPIKPQEVSKTSLKNCLEWWNETMSSRLVDFKKSARVIISERGIAAQLQQQPVPHSGAIFKKEAIKHYDPPPRTPTTITSWDCTFKETGSSYVVGQVWGVSVDHESYILLDQIRARMSFSDTLTAIRKFALKYPHSSAHLIEEKANGSAISDMLRDEIPYLKPVLPEGGKEARAHAVEGLWSAGRILLPDPKNVPWVSDFIQEVLEFPSSINDDQVDAMTQALTWLREKSLRLKTFYKSMNNTGNISCFL